MSRFTPLGLRAAVLVILVAPLQARATDTSTPYIDQLREEMRKRGEPAQPDDAKAESYIDSVRRKVREKGPKTEGTPDESYTERLRRENHLERKTGDPSLIEREKGRLGPSKDGGAIEAVKEGRSALHERRVGTASSLFGLNVGTAVSRGITGDPSAVYPRSFQEVYGSGFAPDLTLFYEHTLIRSDIWGALGLWASLEVAYFSGPGVFAAPINNAVSNQPVGDPSVKFQFFEAPLTVGASYRMTLLRFFQPFAIFGPTLIGFYEARNDQKPGKTGNSRGVYGSIGALIPLDWINPRASWDAYAESGVRHIYLTVAYVHQSTFSGPISFSIDGATAGVAFEF